MLRFLFPALVSVFMVLNTAGLAKAADVFTFFEPPVAAEFIKSIAASREIDGVAIPVIWSEIESQKDQYNWKSLDENLDILIQNNKKITLHIISRYAGTIPAWIADNPDKVIMFKDGGVTRKILVPWSQPLTDNYIDFIQALALHLADKNYTAHIAYVGQGVNMIAKTDVPGCRNGYSDVIKFDLPAYRTAVVARINALLDAFPASIIQMEAPPTDICGGDKSGALFVDGVLDELGKRSSRIMLMAPDLSARKSERLSDVGFTLERMHVGVRFIWSYEMDKKDFFGGKFANAACLGAVGYKATYFEVFYQDFMDENDDIIEPLRSIRRNDTFFCRDVVNEEKPRAVAR